MLWLGVEACAACCRDRLFLMDDRTAIQLLAGRPWMD